MDQKIIKLKKLAENIIRTSKFGSIDERIALETLGVIRAHENVT
jgi:hypothetical protein